MKYFIFFIVFVSSFQVFAKCLRKPTLFCAHQTIVERDSLGCYHCVPAQITHCKGKIEHGEKLTTVFIETEKNKKLEIFRSNTNIPQVVKMNQMKYSGSDSDVARLFRSSDKNIILKISENSAMGESFLEMVSDNLKIRANLSCDVD